MTRLDNRTSKSLFLELAGDYSAKHDPWGYAMGAYFDVAAACYERNIHVPTYSPGVDGPNIDDEHNRELLESLDDKTLAKLAKFCQLLTHFIDKAGRSY